MYCKIRIYFFEKPIQLLDNSSSEAPCAFSVLYIYIADIVNWNNAPAHAFCNMHKTKGNVEYIENISRDEGMVLFWYATEPSLYVCTCQ